MPANDPAPEFFLALTPALADFLPALPGATPLMLPGTTPVWRFARPTTALAAVLSLPAGTPLTVALHSGVLLRDRALADAPLLHRLLALLAATHPGQILLSGAAARALESHLPPGSALRDLGRARLGDLLGREQLFQLDPPDSHIVFPAPRTLDAVPNNLSPQLYSLVGRAGDIAAITDLLIRPAPRLVTLRGPAGTGKTRLAIQVAGALLPRFPGGVWFVALAPLDDPALVPSAVARALGLTEGEGHSLLNRLEEALGAQPTLLVLDNLEGLLGTAPFISALLSAVPTLRVLATSRELLHLPEEHSYEVVPLALPPPNSVLESLASIPAVALFVARATEAAPDFALTMANAEAVTAICTLLDGLPLALELAAARVGQWPPNALLAHLRGASGHAALPALAGGASHLPARQQTLRGAIGWSYTLLAPPEADLFTSLAVFAGSWGNEAVAAVAGDLANHLDMLVEKSLVQRAGEETASQRYWLLETIREYAVERLREHRQATEWRRRHAVYYRDLAEAAVWETEAHAAWINRLRQEYDNLRAALQWTRETGAAELGLRLATALVRYWGHYGPLQEGCQWMETFLALPDIPHALRMTARRDLGFLLLEATDLDAAEAFTQETLRLARAEEDAESMAPPLHQLGIIAYQRGDYRQAEAYYQECLALRRQLGAPLRIVSVLDDLGAIRIELGDLAGAEGVLQEGLTLAEQLGSPIAVGWITRRLGRLYMQTGDWERAQTYLETCIARSRQANERAALPSTLADLADVARLRGDYEEAQRLGLESLQLWRDLGERSGIAEALVTVARTALAQDNILLAQRLFGAALRRFEEQKRWPGVSACLYGLAIAAGKQGDRHRAGRLAGAARALATRLNLTQTDRRQAPDLGMLEELRTAGNEMIWEADAASGAALPIEVVFTIALQES